MDNNASQFQRSRRSRQFCGKSTPYNTPRSKVFKWTKEERELHKDNNSNLSELAQKTWLTYKATPLFAFSYRSLHLKKYSLLLSARLEVMKAKNLGILIGSEETFRAKFSVLPGIAIRDDQDEAVKINVMVMDKNDNSKEAFCGILCCVKSNKNDTEDLPQRNLSAVLPVFLTRGNLEFRKCVIQFLEDNFSCYVSPMQFSSFELSWQAAMWAVDSKVGSIQRHLQLVYSLPWKELHTVEYDISASTIEMIWKRIHNTNSKCVLVEEVNQFIDALNKHFFCVFGIKISSFPLSQVTTQAAAVHSSGKLKILQADSVHQVLHHLTTVAKEYLSF